MQPLLFLFALAKLSMMDERLLQFIWQFQYFNKSELKTADGEVLYIVNPGKHNTHQGPDFHDAKVKIDDTLLAGNIELHLKASDWNRHHHNGDGNYGNVILHVVWEHDIDIWLTNVARLPVLILQPLVPKVLLERFSQLMVSKSFVSCESFLPELDEMKWIMWTERIAIERLQRKAYHVEHLLSANNHNWEEVFWWLLARNFGMKTNAEIFEIIAKSIPLNVLAKHKNQIHQLEGWLLGQAGLLDKIFVEDYPNVLKKEYLFYCKKYNLQQPKLQPYFLRMRPANFPTIRLAQLAMLVHHSSHLFSKIKEATSVDEIKKLLNVMPNDYWHYHYLLDEAVEYKLKPLGLQMTENIIINTVVPILFAYGNYYGNLEIKDKAILWLQSLSPEKNAITNKWKSLKVANSNALQSQALIELKNNYCNNNRCLECSVGNSILKRSIDK